MSDATDPPNEEREGEQSAESVAPVRERMRRFLADSFDEFVFVCSDAELLDVADSVGLSTRDPAAEST